MLWVCGKWGITHTEFTTAGTPNGRVGPAAITPIPVGSAFQTMVEFNPTTTTALMVFNCQFSSLGGLYRSNRRWKYHTDAFIATPVKVAIVISESVVVFISTCSGYPIYRSTCRVSTQRIYYYKDSKDMSTQLGI